jgi:hypothetical protein
MNTNQSLFGFLATFNTALAGVSGGMLPMIQTVSYSILTVAFLLGVYEAYFRQGSVRDLAVSLFKTAIAGFVIMNWGTFTGSGGSYSGSGVFPDIYNGLASIASYISVSYNANDVIGNWGNQFTTFYNQNGVTAWSLFSGGSAAVAGVIGYLMSVVCVFLFVISYVIFTFLYCFWGCVLFVMGPLLVALMPSTTVNTVAKTYARNLAEWACWPILYATFSCLSFAIQADTVNGILQSTNFVDVVQGTTSVIYISLMSLVYGVCLLLIPFLAHYIMAADFMGVYQAGMGVALRAGAAIGAGAGVFSGMGAGISAGSGGVGGAGSGHYGSDSGSGSVTPERTLSTPPSTTPANDVVQQRFD